MTLSRPCLLALLLCACSSPDTTPIDARREAAAVDATVAGEQARREGGVDLSLETGRDTLAGDAHRDGPRLEGGAAALGVVIAAPVDPASGMAGDSVSLAATAQGGQPPYGFAWSSSKDGVLGAGASLSVTKLSTADHQLTVTVTDGAGKTASAQRALHVLPRQLDWSHKVLPSAPPAAGDWLSPVKNQQQCGGCWAFAVAGLVEAKWNIQQGNPALDVDLSEQFLIDCSPGSLGCIAGSQNQALNFMQTNGIPGETCDPFLGNDDTCPATCKDGSAPKRWRISGWKSFGGAPGAPLAETQQLIRDHLVHDGPVLKEMFMNTWSAATLKCTQATGSHVVLIVGYDHDAALWVVKNSWGATWNGNGYFKVAYGQCAIDNSGMSIDGVIAPP